jgi:hypothetical protein
MKIGFRISLLIVTIWQVLDLLQVGKCAGEFDKQPRVYNVMQPHPFWGCSYSNMENVALFLQRCHSVLLLNNRCMWTDNGTIIWAAAP